MDTFVQQIEDNIVRYRVEKNTGLKNYLTILNSFITYGRSIGAGLKTGRILFICSSNWKHYNLISSNVCIANH
jgi:hypothetical protein